MRRILVDDAKCLACHACELACAVAHSESKTLFGAIAEQSLPISGMYVEPGVKGRGFPLNCRHCQDPQCVRACVTKALHSDPNGAVVFDKNRCLGCQMCFIACPFGAIAEASSDSCFISKCDLCSGSENAFCQSQKPACVCACPTRALVFEDADDFSKSKRRKYLVELAVSSDQAV